jgi:F-type H+-transporting ATPase subunit a
MVVLAAFAGALAFSGLAVASTTEHPNSLFAYLVPASVRAQLYSYDNWGQKDVLPNTLFIGVAVLLVLGLMARKLRDVPEGRGQAAVELLVEGLNKQFTPVLGPRGVKYLPFVNSYFILILAWNLAGLVPGLQAPTAELNTTLALAAVSIVAVQGIAIRELGVRGYLKHLSVVPGPIAPLMFVLEVVTQFARVLSLSLRLFANIYAKEVVLGVLYTLAIKLFYIPVQLPVLFIGLLASLIQAFIFAILTSVYIGQFLAEHDHSEHHAEGGVAHAHGAH